MVGTNDIETCNAEMIRKNIVELFAELRRRSPTSRLAWVSILPRPLDFWYFRQRVLETNHIVKAALKQNGVHRVSAHSRFLERTSSGDTPRSDRYDDDGLHPNTSGNIELAQCINQFLFNLFRSHGVSSSLTEQTQSCESENSSTSVNKLLESVHQGQLRPSQKVRMGTAVLPKTTNVNKKLSGETESFCILPDPNWKCPVIPLERTEKQAKPTDIVKPDTNHMDIKQEPREVILSVNNVAESRSGQNALGRNGEQWWPTSKPRFGPMKQDSAHETSKAQSQAAPNATESRINAHITAHVIPAAVKKNGVDTTCKISSQELADRRHQAYLYKLQEYSDNDSDRSHLQNPKKRRRTHNWVPKF